MAFYVLDPGLCDWTGGTLLDLQYPWSGTAPYSCRLVVGGQDLPCYGAQAGGGNDLVPAGLHLRLATPPLPAGTVGDGQLVVRDASGAVQLRADVLVTAPVHLTTTYALRRLLPSTWAVGPRGIADEPPAQTG